MIKTKVLTSIAILSVIVLFLSCSKKISGNSVRQTADNKSNVEFWLTKSDQSALLQKQPATLFFGTITNSNPTINIDTTQTFQTVDGFGYSLTGGSAYVINRLAAPVKASLLKELFGNDDNSIGVSYLRISIGASDLNASVFSYDDMPAGQTDVNLDHFSLDPDKADVIPLLKEILAINPSIKILGSPWSPPLWMKDNCNSSWESMKITPKGI